MVMGMPRRSDTLVAIIGGLKLVKATLLLAAGISGLIALPHRLSRLAERAVGWIGFFPGRGLIEEALQKLSSLDRAAERRLALFSLAYAAVFLVEGVGLLLRKRWAEWMTVVVTGSFIPIEIYELVKEFGVGKVVALILNVAIVIYLAWRRLEERKGAFNKIRHALGAS
jgi:uncharacterized membrane protein (DUF2068 family)